MLCISTERNVIVENLNEMVLGKTTASGLNTTASKISGNFLANDEERVPYNSL